MPPLTKSRLVIPAGYSHITVKMLSPATEHPPSFGFGTDSDDGASLGTALGEWMSTGPNNFLDRVFPTYTVDRIVIRTSDMTIEQPVSAIGTGEGDVDLPPPQVSALVKEITTTPGRHGRGRMYWPGVLEENDIDEAGRIRSETVTSLQAVADKLLSDLDDEGIAMVVLHSYSWPYGDEDPGEPVGFPAPSTVTNVIAESLVATQRRRLR